MTCSRNPASCAPTRSPSSSTPPLSSRYSRPQADPGSGSWPMAGAWGSCAATRVEAAGLDVVPMPDATRRALRAGLPDTAAVGNPVDLLAGASPQQFADAIDALATSGAVDSIVVLYVPPLVTDPDAVAAAVRAAAERAMLPVVAVFATPEAPVAFSGRHCFRFPEDAARALGRAARYGAWRAMPPGPSPTSRSTTPRPRRSSRGRSHADRDGWRPRRPPRCWTATASPSRARPLSRALPPRWRSPGAGTVRSR